MKQLHNKIDRNILKQQILSDIRKRKTLSFYAYYQLPNPRFFRDHFYILLSECEVLGRIYVANEGVNGQMSVPSDRVEDFVKAMRKITFLKEVRLNFAIEDDGKSFFKLAIKVRDKIVADGLNDQSFDVTNKGVHLNAVGFNNLVKDKNTIVVDMRNHYESEVGKFKQAITPDVETFKEALPLVESMLEDKKDHNIIMYCTGGIRCEKASAYYKHRGFSNVFQLEGGIIEYARQAKEQNLENHFIGKNFVFDERLGERISEEVISNCHQCGKQSDIHTNCANDACHILFIQCENCKEEYANTCSVKCKTFNTLPDDERSKLKLTTDFNGTKFGKGRYKAARHAEIDLD